jgi:GntR family transcriptional repressor for pyruvate dehydrogenase complex
MTPARRRPRGGSNVTPETAPTPLERARLSDRVATELKRLVVVGTYPAGARLPTGQELAERFGVTRLTVREALQQLEASGWTRTRHGSGTYVADLRQPSTLQALAETLAAGREMTADEIRHLLAFRDVVVLGFVDAVVEHARAEHVTRLESLLAAEREALGDADRLAALDLAINEQLAAASANLFYVLLLGSVREAHLHLGQIVFRNCGDGSIVVDTHAAIVAALRKRDAAALRRRVGTYLAGGRKIIEAWLRSRT